MYIIEMKRDGEWIYNGAVAMAMQVYAQNHIFLDEPILFPYMTDPFVQIGRYQNAMEEVNMDYVEANDIQMVRRDTGGGTVYLDRGEINICFLMDSQDTNAFSNFDKMYQPVMQILREIGVDQVEKSGRNDLMVDGKKVSGAAMTMKNGRVYGGYSLLFDVDMDNMVNALRPNQKKIESKGIKSVRSRVGNLRDYVDPEYKDLTSEEFLELILVKTAGVESYDQIKKYQLTDEDWAAIDQMMEEKYANWDWIFGASPRFEYNRNEHFKGGTFDISLAIEQGRIKDCKIYGDFFGSQPISDIESALVGTPLRRQDLLDQLKQFDLSQYFGTITADEIVGLILEQ
ncbi:lipoate--protein ligase [Aerococcus sanguinicola]|uniref:lipoate--protein ligase n=1 Tax=Aerococcus sanguinicola TaxID=119206 RepID=A0A0X8FC24_9LACT|nr:MULTISPECIES: lipoate--protein ligase [Aerococcus]AMB94498.1 lipoate--protein ligase [Aerococcus sanguinicola]MDK7049376.1 lipoate--protein ligase [Aerococcus sanguinicola]OFT95624.1 lipoate--protein ligase [Aerococcus sp. HMSC23C02]PKZ23506.1 lipoate--protein ligase [Aerococcus sanguinicola]